MKKLKVSRTLKGYILILLFTVFPLIFVGLIEFYAETVLGCNLSEGGITNCDDVSKETQKRLYGLSMSGWYFLLTLPIGIIALLIWTIVVLRKK